MSKWILIKNKYVCIYLWKHSLNHVERHGKKKVKTLIKQIEQANERKRVQIECAVWHLDVGLAHPHERRNHEGFDCSSIKELHELGLIRRETVWFLSSRGNLSKIKMAPLYERNWVCWPIVYLLFIKSVF